MTTLLFDLDGTLVDSAPDLCKSLNAALALRSIGSVSVDQTRAMTGSGARKLVDRALDYFKCVDQPGLRENVLNDFLLDYNRNCCNQTALYPTVRDTLVRLGNRFGPLGLCTNKPIGPATAVLEHLGISHLFGAVYGGDSVAAKKPEPDMLLACLSDLGADTHDAILIGDSEVDEQAAARAGIKFVGVRYGYGAEAISPNANTIHSFDGLLEMLHVC